MVDLRTLLILASVADLMLATALWIGAQHGQREGISAWSAALVVRALAFGLMAGGFVQSDGALALAGALLALSITLQAAALLAFDGRSLPGWIHPTVIAGAAIPLQLLSQEPSVAVLFGGVMAGLLLAGLAAIAWHLRAPSGPSAARIVVVASLAAAALGAIFRALSATIQPDVVLEMQAPSGYGAAAMLGLFATGLVSTLGFLLMHKERAEVQAARLATFDPLTGACNRRTFHEAAERELARARRQNLPLSLVMVDVDHFRAINAEHGHVAGDEVLARVAQEIRAALRQEDMLVRFGGDEFLVMLPGVPGPGAVVVAGRIRRNVAAKPIEARGRSFPLTVSLGVSARLDEGPESVENLLARAGSALALAQERGRNRVVALSLGRPIAA